MDELQKVIEQVKNNLEKDFEETLLNNSTLKDYIVDISSEYSNFTYITLFAALGRKKKGKPAPIETYFSYGEELDPTQKRYIISNSALLKLHISHDPYGAKYGKVRVLTRQLYSAVQEFCNDYNLIVKLVPFQVVFNNYDETDDRVILFTLPKFEYLQLDYKHNKKGQQFDMKDFFQQRAKEILDLMGNI